MAYSHADRRTVRGSPSGATYNQEFFVQLLGDGPLFNDITVLVLFTSDSDGFLQSLTNSDIASTNRIHLLPIVS